MDLGLDGKAALVTGASKGIGLACATSLLAEGAHVLSTSRSSPPAIAGLIHFPLDMTGLGAAGQAVEETVTRFGSLDILVNNVGGADLSSGFADESDERWAQVLDLNLLSAMRTTRAALPHLIERSGVVVNVSSVNGRLPNTSLHAYSAAKAALDNLTVGLSNEFAPKGVRVVGVAPGSVGTPLWFGPAGIAETVAARTSRAPRAVVEDAISRIPIRRFTTAEEVGDLVAFLASPRAGTITGATVRIDGGINPSL